MRSGARREFWREDCGWARWNDHDWEQGNQPVSPLWYHFVSLNHSQKNENSFLRCLRCSFPWKVSFLSASPCNVMKTAAVFANRRGSREPLTSKFRKSEISSSIPSLLASEMNSWSWQLSSRCLRGISLQSFRASRYRRRNRSVSFSFCRISCRSWSSLDLETPVLTTNTAKFFFWFRLCCVHPCRQSLSSEFFHQMESCRNLLSFADSILP